MVMLPLLTATLAATDAAEAVMLMNKAGFVPGSTVYFDIEDGTMPSGSYQTCGGATFNFMSGCLRLTPDGGNDMCTPARDGVWIHDGDCHGPHGGFAQLHLPAVRGAIEHIDHRRSG